MSTFVVTPASTCISAERRPSASTSMSVGENTPGMLADAVKTLRNRSSAPGSPLAAILPISQIAVRCASRLVITTVEPTSCPVLSRDRGEHGAIDMSRDQVSQGFRLEKTRAKQSRQSLRLQQVRHFTGGKHTPERLV